MTNESQEAELPPLIDLPVYRDTYLSQKGTNELCRLLWSKQPKLIADLAQAERTDTASRVMVARRNAAVIHFLRREEKAGRVDPLSMTGMVDFIYELDRRVRKALGMGDIPVFGKPIAPGPIGPFPMLAHKPVTEIKGKPRGGMTQEMADRLCQKVYDIIVQEHPDALYAYVEMWRRHERSGEPSWEVANVAKEVAKDEGISWVHLKNEFGSRVTMMCTDNGPREEGDDD